MSKNTDSQDLFGSPPGLNGKKRIFTVSEITQDIKLVLEANFRDIWIEGEISNFRPSSAGHYYFSLKDQTSLLQAVIFNRSAKDLKFKLEDGQKVICFGNIELYGPRGQYQIIIEKIEPKGVGSLQLALEQLKQKLEKEGIFAPAHKKPIPHLPSRIGVVTSLQGAAIKDILKVLDRRFKETHIIINPARVQGEGAKEDISRAIAEFNDFNRGVPAQERIEVMIVGRGGGSIEDLWAFNEEIVARAIYNSQIPVISAVGHERDVTIADLVADVRAATPSVAAEIVIPRKEDLEEELAGLTADLKRSLQDSILGFSDSLEDYLHRLNLSIDHILELNIKNFDSACKKLVLLNPVVILERYREKMQDFLRQINLGMAHFMKLKQAELSQLLEKLSSLSPLNILARGYSITFSLDGGTIKDAKNVKPGGLIMTRLHRGKIISEVKEVKENG
ncbi:MAG: exodeoxyribonuclease VII large subunit [Candidatus Omnitrophica bacterium]|nr:exodeoxyribonuclease VII large subunit [Candidatus Omnitrophota bacterium]